MCVAVAAAQWKGCPESLLSPLFSRDRTRGEDYRDDYGRMSTRMLLSKVGQAPPEPEQPAPQPPQPEIPPSGPQEPHLPSPGPEPLPSPVPGPTDPALPRPLIATKSVFFNSAGPCIAACGQLRRASIPIESNYSVSDLASPRRRNFRAL